MTWILVLFLGGIVLLTAEVIVPGGILGVIGGILLLGGVIVAFADYGVTGGATAAGAAVLLVAIAVYLELVLLPRSRFARKLSMSATVGGTSQPQIADRAKVIGRHVIAVTALAPTGYVELEGRRYEAFARHGMTRIGEELEVIDVDNFRLIVSKPSTHPTK
jgi:membrane-bound ClpP family serine protease